MQSLVPWKRGSNGGSSTTMPIGRWQTDIDRVFDRLLSDFWNSDPATALGPAPRLELAETDDQIVVRIEAPGVDPNELEVNLSGDVLTISGEKKQEAESGEGPMTYSERSYGKFQRSVQLRCPVDGDKIRAESHHGVVTITLPKAESVRPKRIEIRSK